MCKHGNSQILVFGQHERRATITLPNRSMWRVYRPSEQLSTFFLIRINEFLSYLSPLASICHVDRAHKVATELFKGTKTFFWWCLAQSEPDKAQKIHVIRPCIFFTCNNIFISSFRFSKHGHHTSLEIGDHLPMLPLFFFGPIVILISTTQWQVRVRVQLYQTFSSGTASRIDLVFSGFPHGDDH